MDIEGDLKFKFVRQLSHELVNVSLVFVKIVFNCLLKPLIEVKRQKVILVDSIQDGDTLLQFGIGLIVVLKNGGKRSRGK